MKSRPVIYSNMVCTTGRAEGLCEDVTGCCGLIIAEDLCDLPQYSQLYIQPNAVNPVVTNKLDPFNHHLMSF